jgi:hypothetical protein
MDEVFSHLNPVARLAALDRVHEFQPGYTMEDKVFRSDRTASATQEATASHAALGLCQ